MSAKNNPSEQPAVQTLIPDAATPTDDEMIAVLVAARKRGDALDVHSIMDRWQLDYEKALQLSDVAMETTDAPAIEAEATLVDPAPAANSPAKDAQLAVRLTAQYHRAMSGMQEVLIFGAMMLIAQRVVCNVEHNSPKRGPTAKGRGFKAWLEAHCPEINRSAAYRLQWATEAVVRQFPMPRKALKYGSALDLILTPAEQLPDALVNVQKNLWDFANGRSKNSWIDVLKPKRASRRVKERGASKEKPIPKEDTPERTALDLWLPILRDLDFHGVQEKTWAYLPEEQLQQLDILIDTIRSLRKEGVRNLAR